MDGLAMLGFVKNVRLAGGAVGVSRFPFSRRHHAGLPVLRAAVAGIARPGPSDLINSVNAVAGLIACAVALVIFEVRKVELANYLPGLAVAPLLAWLFGH